MLESNLPQLVKKYTESNSPQIRQSVLQAAFLNLSVIPSSDFIATDHSRESVLIELHEQIQFWQAM